MSYTLTTAALLTVLNVFRAGPGRCCEVSVCFSLCTLSGRSQKVPQHSVGLVNGKRYKLALPSLPNGVRFPFDCSRRVLLLYPLLAICSNSSDVRSDGFSAGSGSCNSTCSDVLWSKGFVWNLELACHCVSYRTTKSTPRLLRLSAPLLLGVKCSDCSGLVIQSVFFVWLHHASKPTRETERTVR